MSMTETVIACLSCWSRSNGYQTVAVSQVSGSERYALLTPDRYFKSMLRTSEHIVFVHGCPGAPSSTKLLVLYDKELHRNRSNHCPYLVFKLVQSQVVDLRRRDFMAVVKAINEVLQVIPAAPNQPVVALV
ncbi:hypothetical protein DFH29DRAFT_1010401 [Suillus ampliporus]|nr:hypothetical protein DFH29DRAFT_1010401 [Suillus ampliporus]